jgi:hypothetical protein
MDHTINSRQATGSASPSLIEEPAQGHAENNTPALTYDSRRITIAPTVVNVPAVFPATP